MNHDENAWEVLEGAPQEDPPLVVAAEAVAPAPILPHAAPEPAAVAHAVPALAVPAMDCTLHLYVGVVLGVLAVGAWRMLRAKFMSL